MYTIFREQCLLNFRGEKKSCSGTVRYMAGTVRYTVRILKSFLSI